MIYNYEVISSSKLDRSKSYIDFKKRQLFIKGIRLPTRKYYMYLRKLDVMSNLNIVLVLISVIIKLTSQKYLMNLILKLMLMLTLNSKNQMI